MACGCDCGGFDWDKVVFIVIGIITVALMVWANY